MKAIARYLTHPQVVIDPNVDVEKWSLNEHGRARLATLVDSNALHATRSIVSSTETKAIETGQPLAKSLGIELNVHENMHENDRRATGFLVPDEFEQAAYQFFANPKSSYKGWETAINAQQRIVEAVDSALQEPMEGDVLFVGHGGVGTLLLCHLLGVAIDRKMDQMVGGGQYFEFEIESRRVLSRWMPIEHLIST